MRPVPASITRAWNAEVNLDEDTRPVVRATIQNGRLQRTAYDCGASPGDDFAHQRGRQGDFTSIIFGREAAPVELRNIRSCTWSRSVDQDVAECTLTLLNAELSPIGNAPAVADTEDFDLPGYMSPDRGEPTLAANRWGHTDSTGWTGRLLPDRVVRTYEGYGVNPFVVAANDENLVQTGVWIIDTATFDNELGIVLKMRDVGRLLLDQIVFPPAIPHTEYPLAWEAIHTANEAGRAPTGGGWTAPGRPVTSSNEKYLGKGLENPPARNYVGPGGAVNGHRPGDALTQHATSDEQRPYWLSTGQPRKASMVWWQAELNPTALAGIRLDPRGGPYHVYISVKGPDGWIGRKKIPYQRDHGAGDVNIEADIPFVKQELVRAQVPTDILFPRVIKRARAVRMTITRLYDTGVGGLPLRRHAPRRPGLHRHQPGLRPRHPSGHARQLLATSPTS